MIVHSAGAMLMTDISEQCWARIDSLRFRVKSVCNAADPAELRSIDAEMVELKEMVCSHLDAQARRESPSRTPPSAR